MESKYNIMNNNNNKNTNSSKFTNNGNKRKPSPIIFGLNNGTSNNLPKKIKLDEVNLCNRNAGSNQNVAKSSFNGKNINGKDKVSLQEHRRRLPVFEKRNKLLELIKNNKTLIIMGETGSGKTTQIPQYINSARLQENGRIAITQPRRVAAISVALRVAQEYGNGLSVGDVVGYSVRFEDVTSNRTRIKYLTDGMLLREAMNDELLSEYTVVILDEAHERTIHTDVLFGIVKKAQKVRQQKNLAPLKILIMSATMDVDHFSKYFNNCQAVYLEGRTYPVNVFYTTKPYDDYQTTCVATFFNIHKKAPANHDVLIFLTGQEEIESVAHQIRTLSKDPDVEGPNVRIFTLYAAQPSTQQMLVFQPMPPNTRKVIISTNIAETSVTISGIKYVIDSGMVKARAFHPSTGLELLKVQRISQEQAWQRTGRAGRDSEGFCYRIYTRSQFEAMKTTTVPEIQRANLNTVTLQLLALNINALQFDFMDKPPKEAVLAALQQLHLLQAVKFSETNSTSSENVLQPVNIEKSHISLTGLGKKLAKFPLDPRYSKILLNGEHFGCLEEALTIVALLSGESILLSPPSKKDVATERRNKFKSAYGDHITLLNIYREFNNVGQNNKRSWCQEYYINMRNILHAREVRNQLQEICKKCDLNVLSSCGSDLDQLRKCLLSGLFMNVAQLYRDRMYITLDKRQMVYIHPGSILHGQQPHLIIYSEVVQTNKCYVRQIGRAHV